MDARSSAVSTKIARIAAAIAAVVAVGAFAGCASSEQSPPTEPTIDRTSSVDSAALARSERQAASLRRRLARLGRAGEARPYADSRDCGEGVTAGPNTSCEFALNVRSAYSGQSTTVHAYSPVTRLTYAMSCTGAGTVTCTGGNDASVSFGDENGSGGGGGGNGGGASADDSGTVDTGAFCSTHECIGDWSTPSGTVVECADGTWSHSRGVQGACSSHEGVK